MILPRRKMRIRERLRVVLRIAFSGYDNRYDEALQIIHELAARHD